MILQWYPIDPMDSWGVALHLEIQDDLCGAESELMSLDPSPGCWNLPFR